MTPKERAAMQPSQQAVAAMRLALEALEEAREMIGYPANMVLYEKELALRSALAESEALVEPDWGAIGREQLRRYKEKFGDFEQAEQSSKAATPTTLAEPVAWWHPKMGAYDNNYFDAMQPLYLSPVRTKDLTDDEIAQAVGSPLDEVYLADFRAVIAKFKEKNRV